MRTVIRQNRDARIDFFRGIALWCMFIDHLIDGSLHFITLKQFAFCDSAELFVLLSGISAGMVYCRTALRKGLAAGRVRILGRVAGLYRAHLIMLVLFLSEAGFLMARLNPPSFLEFYNLQAFSNQPYRSLLNSVLMRYQPQYLDILPLYIVLLLLLFIALPLLLRWPQPVLGASVALYVATRLFHLVLPSWAGEWYFNPLAWQVIFVIGLVSQSVLANKRYWRGWDVLAALFALFGLIESHAHRLSHFLPSKLLVHVIVDKANLHPLKLLSIVSLAWLVWRYLPASASWLRSRWVAPFVFLGQHSLPVFASGVMFSVMGQAWFAAHKGWVSQVVVQGGGTLALFGVAAWSAWNGQESQAGAPAKAPHEPKIASTNSPAYRNHGSARLFSPSDSGAVPEAASATGG
jgi:hypothetical protein